MLAALTCWLSVVSQIRNGSTADSPLMERLCGSTLPSPIFPQSNLLYLRFKSDFSNARNGFEATWTSSPHGQNWTVYTNDFKPVCHETSRAYRSSSPTKGRNCCCHQLIHLKPKKKSEVYDGVQTGSCCKTTKLNSWEKPQLKHIFVIHTKNTEITFCLEIAVELPAHTLVSEDHFLTTAVLHFRKVGD